MGDFIECLERGADFIGDLISVVGCLFLAALILVIGLPFGLPLAALGWCLRRFDKKEPTA